VYCTLSVFLQILARRERAIVNIASIGGRIAVPHMLPYTASKFAVVGFSVGLNAELRTKGIRVENAYQ
jgi:short-subunit dehydrogenase